MADNNDNNNNHITKPIVTIETSKYADSSSTNGPKKLSNQNLTDSISLRQRALSQINNVSYIANKLPSQVADIAKGFPIHAIDSLLLNFPKTPLPDLTMPNLITDYADFNDSNNFDLLDIEPDTTMVDNQIKQTALLEQMVQHQNQQSQNSELMKLVEPRYDRKSRVIIFANTQIRLTADSDNEIICKKLFWNGRPVKYPVEKGDIMEQLGTTDKKAFYNKVASLNKLIQKETGVEKLFDFVDKKLWFNTKYVELPL